MNRSPMRLAGERVSIALPNTVEQPPASLTVIVGFQPTESELALNRQIGGR